MNFSSADDVAMILPLPTAHMSGYDALQFINLEEYKIPFEASFIPSLSEFGRLDLRFQLPEDVWHELPQYAEYGFAVFKLRSSAAKQHVHPTAFTFP